MRNLVRENILSMKPYTASKDIAEVKLDANENPFNLFKDLKEEFVNIIENLELNRYPEIDNQCLGEKIAEYAGVKSENVICGNGSDEIIQMIIHSFVDKDDYIVIPVPTFSMYKQYTEIGGGKVLEVPTDDSFNVREDEIINIANEKRAKVIFLCNPNNPTGTIIKREKILNILNRTNSIVVVDEAYYEFLDETIIDQVNINNRLIVLRTLSKGFALAGARVGYGIGSREIIDIISKVRSPYNLSSISQALGILFLENVDRIREKIKEIKNERSYLIEEIQRLNGIYVYPSGSNFVLIKSDKAKNILSACGNEKIALRGFSDSYTNNCIRITIGKREENDKLISLIKRVV
ncbi:MAG: hisC [Clostridiales bacterium]|nr:hisC [Clostridiales bacterium]